MSNPDIYGLRIGPQTPTPASYVERSLDKPTWLTGDKVQTPLYPGDSFEVLDVKFENSAWSSTLKRLTARE